MPSSLRSVANSTHSGRWSLMRGETWVVDSSWYTAPAKSMLPARPLGFRPKSSP